MSIVISDLLNRCTFPEGPLECAVSGGADSMALLVLATQVSSEVKAIHVDHGIRKNSDAEADFVFQTAQSLGATFESVAIEVQPARILKLEQEKHDIRSSPKMYSQDTQQMIKQKLFC